MGNTRSLVLLSGWILFVAGLLLLILSGMERSPQTWLGAALVLTGGVSVGLADLDPEDMR